MQNSTGDEPVCIFIPVDALGVKRPLLKLVGNGCTVLSAEANGKFRPSEKLFNI